MNKAIQSLSDQQLRNIVRSTGKTGWEITPHIRELARQELARRFRRGDRISHKGREGMVVFAFPNGTPDAPYPWAKVVLTGTIFACVPMSELEHGGDYGR